MIFRILHEITAQLKEGIDYADILANKFIKVYLNISYANKEDGKSMGARWDTEKKKNGMHQIILSYMQN